MMMIVRQRDLAMPNLKELLNDETPHAVCGVEEKTPSRRRNVLQPGLGTSLCEANLIMESLGSSRWSFATRATQA
jgi:hypothetical protein